MLTDQPASGLPTPGVPNLTLPFDSDMPRDILFPVIVRGPCPIVQNVFAALLSGQRQTPPHPPPPTPHRSLYSRGKVTATGMHALNPIFPVASQCCCLQRDCSITPSLMYVQWCRRRSWKQSRGPGACAEKLHTLALMARWWSKKSPTPKRRIKTR